MFNKLFFEIRAVYKIMWKKYGRARQATDGNILRYMRTACWILKATNTHSEYVILIAFPLQQLFQECPSLLRYTYIACHASVCPSIPPPLSLSLSLSPYVPQM